MRKGQRVKPIDLYEGAILSRPLSSLRTLRDALGRYSYRIRNKLL